MRQPFETDRPNERELLSRMQASWNVGDHQNAVQLARKARLLEVLTRDGALAFAWALMSTGQFEDAIALLHRSLVEYPEHGLAQARVGQIYRAEGRLELASVELTRAHMLDHAQTETMRSLGQLSEILGQSDDAVEWFHRAVDTAPKVAQNRHWLAHCQMRSGGARAAWRQMHQAALGDGTTCAELASALPRQDPSAIFRVGGDNDNIATSIYYSRWLPTLRRHGKVFYQCSPRVAGTMRRSFPEIKFVEMHAKPLDNYFLDQASLPFLTESTVPNLGPDAASPFLVADPRKRDIWRKKLRDRFGDRLLIGLSWRSSLTLRPNHFNASTRDRLLDLERQAKENTSFKGQLWRKMIPLKAFEWLFSDPELAVISIQYGLDPSEAEFINQRLRLPLLVDDLDFLANLDEVVAYIAALDAVVTIQNTHAHVAGALGTPTIVLSHEVPAPYWGLMRHMRHYPNVHLIEKTVQRLPNGRSEFHYNGDWSPVVQRALEILKLEIAAEIKARRL